MTRISYTFDTDLTDDDGGYLKPRLGWFSLDAARRVAEEDTAWDGNNMISRATGSQWVHEDLLQTAGGTYVIRRDNADGRFGSYHYVTPTDAEYWLRKQDLHKIADVEFAPIEERGPGRPAIGTQVNVAIPVDVLAAVDDLVAEDGGTRSSVIREAVVQYLA